MNAGRHRLALWTVLGLLVAALAVVAAGCGGGDDEGSASAEIEGLGTSVEEIQANAKDEGQVDLIAWAGYLEDDWVKPFEQQSGCTVNAKIGTTSDEMVTLMRTGNYDGVSASGDATLRLIAGGDVAPVNHDLIPNYENVFEGLKDQPHNTVDGVSYGVPHGRGANLLFWNTEDIPGEQTSWSLVLDADSPAAGKISVYDSPIYIADAAVYLMATQPDLEITNPYELDDTQFNAAVDLLKQQKAGEYWSDAAKQIQSISSGNSTAGTTWQYQLNQLAGRKPAGAGAGDAARGGVDRLVGHLDDRLGGEASELHVPLDGLHHQPGGQCEGDGVLRRGAGQQRGVRLHAGSGPLHEVPCDRRGLLLEGLLLEHADRGLRRRPRRGLQGLLRMDAGLDRDPRLGEAPRGPAAPAPGECARQRP